MRPFKRMLYCRPCHSNTQHILKPIQLRVGILLKAKCTICTHERYNEISEANLTKLADRTETEPPDSQSFI